MIYRGTEMTYRLSIENPCIWPYVVLSVSAFSAEVFNARKSLDTSRSFARTLVKFRINGAPVC